ncbi:hypothetical protein T492DRAFT_1019643 [Pavlovales sp. CCMP2436]|nr:hypothetical protein T492DRAFT_1019643 [Pavlovales sp. CCMP2436]
MGGVPIATFHRPFKFGPAPCKCCCYQVMNVKDMAGADVGMVTEMFWCCVPKYKIVGADGNHLYDFHQPTCCAGQCVDYCDTGGGGCCKVPVYFYLPDGQDVWCTFTIASPTCANVSWVRKAICQEHIEREGKVLKVYFGLENENCCTLANTFEIEAPMEARTGAKLALVYAATTLLDFEFFEGNLYNAPRTGFVRAGGGIARQIEALRA